MTLVLMITVYVINGQFKYILLQYQREREKDRENLLNVQNASKNNVSHDTILNKCMYMYLYIGKHVFLTE